MPIVRSHYPKDEVAALMALRDIKYLNSRRRSDTMKAVNERKKKAKITLPRLKFLEDDAE
jgi:hypothetical protein